MRNSIKDNLAIKILSVIAAVILWFYIQMVQNPDIEYTFNNIKIDFVNSSLLEENSLIIIGETEFFTDVTVKCQRWTLNQLEKQDFMAYVDLSEIKQAGEAILPVKIRLNNENIIIANKSPSVITVNIDRIITDSKPIKINLIGKIKDGYYTNDKLVKSDSNTVTVTGPKSLVDKIANGVISVDINNKSADFSEKYNIILVDSEGTAISSDVIKVLNDTAVVNTSVYLRKIVPIEITGLNENLKYEIKPSSLEIAGAAGVIEGISKITVNDFYLESAKAGHIQDIKITLPQSIIMLTDVTPYIEITGYKNEEGI